MNFGDLLSDDPTNASASGGGNPSHPRAGRVSSGPPPGGGPGPGKSLSSFVKEVGGNRRNSNNTSDNHRRGGTTPESLGDESDPNHNVFGHVGGLGSLSHDLSFLEDMEDSVPIPPGEISLKVKNIIILVMLGYQKYYYFKDIPINNSIFFSIQTI